MSLSSYNGRTGTAGNLMMSVLFGTLYTHNKNLMMSVLFGTLYTHNTKSVIEVRTHLKQVEVHIVFIINGSCSSGVMTSHCN